MPEARRASQSAAVDLREAMLQVINGGFLSQCVYVAAKLGIADFLSDGPRTCDELALETSTHGPSLYRLMRALAGVGIFHEDAKARFGLTPRSELLRSGVQGSVRDWAILRGEDFVWRPWGAILESVRTGASGFRHVFEKGPFEYLQEDQEAARTFDRAMESISAPKFAAVAAAYDFSGIHTLVDVAGGAGGLLTAVLEANSGMQGILVELPRVAGAAREALDSAGLAGRCRCVEADMFESIPAGGDAVILANVIHNWDDDRAIQILSNCRRALRPGSKLLLVELLIAAPNQPHLADLADLDMLLLTDGGRERCESEYAALYEAAGFRLTRVVATESPWSVVEGIAL
jgi:SAM-dependent methyltransferase